MNNTSNLLSKTSPKVLMKNNALIRAKYSLTLNENRIYLLILYKLQKSCDGTMRCYITKSEIKQIIKKTNDRTTKNITELLSSLRSKPIHYIQRKKSNKFAWGECSIISEFKYDEDIQAFIIDSSRTIYDLLNKYLETGYTPANLAVLFTLNNYYAQRLYDLIRLWSGKKNIITYKVEELKEYLMLEDSYPQYGNFKRRVIVPAVEALNKTGLFEIDFKERKEGKKVIAIDFIVKDFDKRTYEFNKDIIENIDLLEIGKAVEENNSIETIPEEEFIKLNKELLSEDIETKDGYLNKFKYNEDIIEDVEFTEIEDEEEKITKKPKAKEKITKKPKIKDKKASSKIKDEFFIPEPAIFTKGTIRLFKKDFADFDFKEKKLAYILDKAIAIVLEKDDTDIISTQSYEYFKSTLYNLISDYIVKEEEEIRHQKEVDKYWSSNIKEKMDSREIDLSRGPVTNENLKKRLFDSGFIDENGYYYK
ncbi:replication initiation protein [Clostridioides sp. ZZV15-6597]|uniref:replication initiation protein n=1 Tax=Clostridioides sp. ZZV15-6597 TaxID=2811500 RepID=UPI001D10DCA6|nr:replication initiation protein [Clostridioides sp. ZZV15-6597]